jgi:hypothetical protein
MKLSAQEVVVAATSEAKETVLRKAFTVIVIVFAAIGFVVTTGTAVQFLRSPSAISTPYGFSIVEITAEQRKPIRVYLAGRDALERVRFEGGGLQHALAPLQHFQMSVPVAGVQLSGTGRMIYGSAVIELRGGEVFVNGSPLYPNEWTLGQNGVLRRGDIRVAR